MNRLVAAALLACACACAVAQEPPSAESGAPAAAVDSSGAAPIDVPHQTGLASWYGHRFHGRKTASGEAFDMHALTAAHPRLPFGSWVRVHNPANGRSVDVRINDRGPHIRRRIIDLSRAAALALGLAGQGTRQVAVTVLSESGRREPL